MKKFSALLLLYSLASCSQKEGYCEVPYSPEIIILYADMDGNPLKRERHSDFEVLSVTNSEGESLRYGQSMHNEYVRFNMWIDERFSNQSPKAERHYTVRYKVTLRSGEERREELKLAYLSDVWGTFTEARYNGIRMKEDATIEFDGTAPVAVLIPDTNMAYLIIPVE
jgi:hypothetical protein